MDKKNIIQRLSAKIGPFFVGLVVAFLIFVAALFYQGVFKGFFIKSSLPTKNELVQLEIDKGDVQYKFNHITFYDFDTASGDELLIDVSLDQYSAILNLLNGSSRVKFDQYLLSQFEKENLARLVINFKQVNQPENTLELPYQSVEFITNGDFFRVKQLNANTPYIWNYYKFPGIYFKIKQILNVPH